MDAGKRAHNAGEAAGPEEAAGREAAFGAAVDDAAMAEQQYVEMIRRLERSLVYELSLDVAGR